MAESKLLKDALVEELQLNARDTVHLLFNSYSQSHQVVMMSIGGGLFPAIEIVIGGCAALIPLSKIEGVRIILSPFDEWWCSEGHKMEDQADITIREVAKAAFTAAQSKIGSKEKK